MLWRVKHTAREQAAVHNRRKRLSAHVAGERDSPALPHTPAAYLLFAVAAVMPGKPKKAMTKQCKRSEITAKCVVSTRGIL